MTTPRTRTNTAVHRDGGQNENGIVRGTAGPTVTTPTLRRAPCRRQDGPRDGRRDCRRQAQASSQSGDRVDSPQRRPSSLAGRLALFALTFSLALSPSSSLTFLSVSLHRRIAKFHAVANWRSGVRGTSRRRNSILVLFKDSSIIDVALLFFNAEKIPPCFKDW